RGGQVLASLDVKERRLLPETALVVLHRRGLELIQRLEKLRRPRMLARQAEQMGGLVAVVQPELDLPRRLEIAGLEVVESGGGEIAHFLGQPCGQVEVGTLEIHLVRPLPVARQAVEVARLREVTARGGLLRSLR